MNKRKLKEFGSCLDPDFIKSFDSPEKVAALNSTVDLIKLQMNNEHEENMAKLRFEQEKKSAGWLFWLGWKNPKLISLFVVLLFLTIIISIMIINDCFQYDNTISFCKSIFDLLKVIIRFL